MTNDKNGCKPVEVESPVLVEGDPVLVEDPVRADLFEERLEKPDVPLVLHPAAVDAVVHQILKRMTAYRHFYSTTKWQSVIPSAQYLFFPF